MMRSLPVVQAQEIDAVVVAVRCAHNRMHVKFRRLGIGQKNAGVMVEFDKDHRTLNPIVEWACLLESADPAEMRVGEMPFDFGQPRGERPWR